MGSFHRKLRRTRKKKAREVAILDRLKETSQREEAAIRSGEAPLPNMLPKGFEARLDEIWTPFHSVMKEEGVEVFKNSLFFVSRSEAKTTLSREADGTPVVIDHLAIKCMDDIPLFWTVLQRIKNELCGPDREAMQIYPSEERLIRTGHYHLWVFPPDLKIPLGMHPLINPGSPTTAPSPADNTPQKEVPA